jgi:protein TonB
MLLLMMLMSTVACAEPPPPPGAAVDMMRYYPERASRLGIEGSAMIRCMVTVEGLLTDCTVVAEQPTDAGFGEAALNMSHLFKMKPATRDGVPVTAGPVSIPIRFQLPPTMPTAPK